MDGPAKPEGYGSRSERPRCTATSRQSSERCRRVPIPGGNVCVMHGGASPNVAAAARARLERAAQAEVATMLGLGTFPVEIPGAFAALCRLHRRRPRWFLAAEATRRPSLLSR